MVTGQSYSKAIRNNARHFEKTDWAARQRFDCKSSEQNETIQSREATTSWQPPKISSRQRTQIRQPSNKRVSAKSFTKRSYQVSVTNQNHEITPLSHEENHGLSNQGREMLTPGRGQSRNLICYSITLHLNTELAARKRSAIFTPMLTPSGKITSRIRRTHPSAQKTYCRDYP